MSLHFILLLTIKLLSKFVLCCSSVLEAVQNEFFYPFSFFILEGLGGQNTIYVFCTFGRMGVLLVICVQHQVLPG